MVGTCLEGLTNQRGGHVGKCGQSTGVLPEPQGFRREVVVTAFEPFVRQRWMAASHDCSYASAACFRTFSNLISDVQTQRETSGREGKAATAAIRHVIREELKRDVGERTALYVLPSNQSGHLECRASAHGCIGKGRKRYQAPSCDAPAHLAGSVGRHMASVAMMELSDANPADWTSGSSSVSTLGHSSG